MSDLLLGIFRTIKPTRVYVHLGHIKIYIPSEHINIHMPVRNINLYFVSRIFFLRSLRRLAKYVILMLGKEKFIIIN